MAAEDMYDKLYETTKDIREALGDDDNRAFDAAQYYIDNNKNECKILRIARVSEIAADMLEETIEDMRYDLVTSDEFNHLLVCEHCLAYLAMYSIVESGLADDYDSEDDQDDNVRVEVLLWIPTDKVPSYEILALNA